MRVILAQPRGFCAGVVRAIEIVDRALQQHGAPVYVRHEIVHNRHVVENLRNKGARFVEELDEVPHGAVAIFSAHGVAQTVERDAEARGLDVLDATCPLVTKVHVQGRQYVAAGRRLILIGHAGHPEVEGTVGQIPGEVILVQSEAEVETLTLPSNIVALVQNAIISAFSGGDGGPRARIGSTIFASRFYSPVAAIGMNVSILSILIGTSSATLASLTVGIDQSPTVTAANISVTLV